MDAQQLADALGCPLPRAQTWIEPLNAAIARFEIDSIPRTTAFLAQIGHESGRLARVQENLNYRAPRLRTVFPRYFNEQQAAEYAHHPNRIAARGSATATKRAGTAGATEAVD